jgi:predicted HTH transcriptional regulator
MLPTTENINTEFKPTFNEDVIESLVAFANAKGGNYKRITSSNHLMGIDAENLHNIIRFSIFV